MAIAKDHKVIISLKDLEMFASPNATRQWLAAERFTIGLAIHPPGGSHDIHSHPDAEEMLYVISGNALIRIYKDDGTYDEYECGPNDFVHVPEGVVHSGTCNRMGAMEGNLCLCSTRSRAVCDERRTHCPARGVS